jgi:hypothetical protein
MPADQASAMLLTGAMSSTDTGAALALRKESYLRPKTWRVEDRPVATDTIDRAIH